MRPLSLDDLLPLEEFAGRRHELLVSHRRYLDRYRRVRIGPRVALIFENRQTLWFRVQDVLRIARLSEAGLVQRELDLYNRLLPGRGRLQAALILDIVPDKPLAGGPAPFQDLTGTQLRFHLAEKIIPAELITCRPEDRCIGAAHWVQFTLEPDSRKLFADFQKPVFLELQFPAYHHQSPTLNDDLRQSLLDDLDLSDRDEKKAAG